MRSVRPLPLIALLVLAGCSVEGPETPASSAAVHLRDCSGAGFIAAIKRFSAQNRMHLSGSLGVQGSAYLHGDGISIFVSNETERCSYKVFFYRERGGSDELVHHHVEALRAEISADKNLAFELMPSPE
jgi:hypothetical protein